MTITPIFSQQYSRLLRHLAENLDISETHAKEAESRYKSIGEWLDRENSTVAKYQPEIYPQGSFLLGTVIRPISEEDDYDIDLVCQIRRDKRWVKQKDIKVLIGDEIKAYRRAQYMKNPVKEGRRCWTLHYAKDAQFHMDILPSLPESSSVINSFIEAQVPSQLAQLAIAITDNQHQDYEKYTEDWPNSNPRGYADWFISRMQIQYDHQKSLLEQKRGVSASVDPVPQYAIKTPLQRVIQILKRHRDIMFEHDQEHKPISIIITTLAAHAYSNEGDLFEALANIIKGMPSFIEFHDDVYWVANPVNPNENFADKWEQYEERKVNFFKWLNQVYADLVDLEGYKDLYGFADTLKGKLGERLVNKSLKNVFPSGISRSTFIPLAQVAYGQNKFDVPQKQSPPWPISEYGSVSITATYTRAKFRAKAVTASTTLPKNSSLRFEAHVKSISKPFKVYWQVVNTGYEAEKAKSLRGGFYDGTIKKGKRIRNESTMYAGTHWVQCYIVKEYQGAKVCVARSKEFIVSIGN